MFYQAKKNIRKIGFNCGLEIRNIIAPYRKGQAIGLPESISNPIFLCSYPRSGNTWTRMLITYLINRGKIQPDIDNIDYYVPDLDNKKYIKNFLGEGKYSRFFKTHSPKLFFMPRIIYNVRDPRDAEASNFLYWTRATETNMSLGEFLFRRSTHKFGFWFEHVEKAIEFSNFYPNRILFVKYEDLKSNPIQELQRIAEFSNLKVNDSSQYEQAVESCLLSKQKSISKKSENPWKKYTLQKGEVNIYQEIFADQVLLNRFLDFCGSTPNKLGYALEDFKSTPNLK